MRIATFITALPLTATIALAQQPTQPLADDQAIPALMFFTLFAGLAIGIGGLLWFLRKRSNRAAMMDD
jgi:hypothetical protein